MDSVTLTELSTICGKDFTAIRAYLDLMTLDYEDLMFNATKTGELLQCKSVNMIYVDAVHDTLCTDVPEAAAWTLFTFLILAVFAMIMITLRSSWLEVIEDSEIVIPSQPASQIEMGPKQGDDSFDDGFDDSFDDSPGGANPKTSSRSLTMTGEISPSGDIQFTDDSSPSPSPQAIDDPLPQPIDDLDTDSDEETGGVRAENASINSSVSDLEQALDDLLDSDDDEAPTSEPFKPIIDDSSDDLKNRT